jgi:hypothetical protein
VSVAARVLGLSGICAAAILLLAGLVYAANWTIEPTLGPSGPAESALTSVSCVSAATCMAVGTDDAGVNKEQGALENVGSFSESWNGSIWAVVPTAGSAGANPTLYGVSCVSAVFCVAVGLAHSNGRFGVNNEIAFGAQRALIEVWNGATWTVEPNPGAAMTASGLFGVSCPSSSFCVAVGQHSEAALVEVWDGARWSVQSTPTVARYGTWPTAVSCVSTHACTLVGSYNANRVPGQAAPVQLAERWNGHAWSVQHVPEDVTGYPALRSVSCVSQSFCMATGTSHMGNGSEAFSPLADRWNGVRWTDATVGLPKASPFYGVSCITAGYCLAAGQFDPRVFPPSIATETLVELWSGARWARLAVPPVAAPPLADQTDPALLGISCLSQIGCTAAGTQAVGSNSAPLVQGEAGAPSALAESPAPVFGRNADVQVVSGTVLVELPGTTTFVPLSAVTSVPLGTIVDATNGTVNLTAATATGAHGGTESGLFYSGIFRITQTKARSPLRGGRSVGITVLSLAGGLPSGCGPTGTKAAAATSQTTRRLWGDAHGNFQTKGRYASATVRGTKWLTEDTCSGTLVKVARGVVSVENLRTHKTVLVRAGRNFLSRSGAVSASVPCTEQALAAGLRRSRLRGRIDGNGFGCAGRFAYAAVIVGAGNTSVEITVLFRADVRGWEVVTRGKYCEDGAVPALIRQPACETN